jgi:uncharacterized spore protein YtfJ
VTTMIDEAMEQAREDVSAGPRDRLVERLAERIGGTATVAAVFGEPIRAGDLTVVPVAKVRWGFGAGSGQSERSPSAPPASGSGGGAGVSAEPAGYLEITTVGATYHPITDARPSPLLLLAGGIALGIVIRAVAKLTGR